VSFRSNFKLLPTDARPLWAASTWAVGGARLWPNNHPAGLKVHLCFRLDDQPIANAKTLPFDSGTNAVTMTR